MAFMCKRWTLANILPVAFVLGTISTIWILYIALHLFPLFFGQVGHAPCGPQLKDSDQVITVYDTANEPECMLAAFRRGTVQTFMQQVVTVLLLVCFGRAASTDPGSVPDDPEWLPQRMKLKKGPEESGVSEESDSSMRKRTQHEVKHTGERRFCKWCNRFKPDRAHHCRVCRSCILRMDHHCPWIANCVGFRNHKYFFLLVFYSLLDCAFVISTMSETMYRSLVQDTQFLDRFLIVFCMTLAVMMGVLLLFFFTFHAWLMFRALTTIEFCEKTYRNFDSSHRVSQSSIYSMGLLQNVRNVLGDNTLLWFLPLNPPGGDGLGFSATTEASVKNADFESETSALLPKRETQDSSTETGHAATADASTRVTENAPCQEESQSVPEVTPNVA